MFLIVGLGNPGSEYEKTRHNAGFMAIDKLAKILKIDIKKNKFDALLGEGMINGEKVILAKPQTYMNLSGVSVSQIMDFYKIDTDNLIVIYDDIDIELGKIRIRKNGSAGTHNGMRNIVQMLATEDFPRVRVGTDKPKYDMNLADYVLAKMNKEEFEKLDIATTKAAEATEKILINGIQVAMNEYN